MESSKLMGGIEECNSSESGWTLYIASPAPDDDDDNDNDDCSSDDDDYDDDDGEDDDSHDRSGEDDESMASDASSGPSDHRRHSYPNADESNRMGQSEHKNEDEEDDNEFARQFMCKEVHRKAGNKRGERKDSTGERRQVPHPNK